MAEPTNFYYRLSSLYLGYWDVLGRFFNAERWNTLWPPAETEAQIVESLVSGEALDQVTGLLREAADAPFEKEALASQLKQDHEGFTGLMKQSYRWIDGRDFEWLNRCRTFRAHCQETGLYYASLLSPPKSEDGLTKKLLDAYPPQGTA